MLADGPDSVGAEPRLEAVVANRRLAVVSISFARRFVEGGEPVGHPEPGWPVVFRSVKRPSCGAIGRRDTANLALLRTGTPVEENERWAAGGRPLVSASGSRVDAQPRRGVSSFGGRCRNDLCCDEGDRAGESGRRTVERSPRRHLSRRFAVVRVRACCGRPISRAAWRGRTGCGRRGNGGGDSAAAPDP